MTTGADLEQHVIKGIWPIENPAATIPRNSSSSSQQQLLQLLQPAAEAA